MRRRKRYLCNCVNSGDGDEINRMKDGAVEINRNTFLKHVDYDELVGMELSLGYAKHHTQGLIMSQDPYVSYHKSTWRGKECVYFTWSGIEYIYV